MQQTARWQDSILFKLSVITLIILVLLIPSSWIEDLIRERANYQEGRTELASEQWSGSQLIQGPVLMLPYKKNNDGIKTIYVLPQYLDVKADVNTRQIEKGVSNVTLYSSKLVLKGTFNKSDLSSLGIDPKAVLYDRAKLVFGISDIKGLKNNPVVTIGGQKYIAGLSADANLPFDKALQISFTMQQTQGLEFSYSLNLNGTNELQFLHTGKTTSVNISSNWKTPQFDDRYLPDNTTITNKGFNAKWQMLHYNRPFPQQWTDNSLLLKSKKAINEAAFGVKLQLPVDQYRKVLRTAKYATLIIILTFVSLFLTELIRKQRIHLFNYILIGAAMVVYYTLLLSFSEQIGYNYAYLLSSVSTIALVASFTGSLLNNKNAAGLFAFILSLFYGFIFIITQMEELSLLAGSIALFVIVAVLMYVSRKINWDNN